MNEIHHQTLETRQQLAAHLGALRRIKGWTRDRFSLGPADTVLVEQAQSTQPGFPPIETLIAFWTSPECRYEFTVFKPATEVDEGDLPPAWMRSSLKTEIVAGCTCC